MAFEAAGGVDSGAFGQIFREAERRTLQEVERLNRALDAARAENEQLRSRLASGAASYAGDGEIKDQPHAVATPVVVNEGNQEAARPVEGNDGVGSETPQGGTIERKRSLILPVDEEQTRHSHSVVREILAARNCSTKTTEFQKETGLAQQIVKSPMFEYGTLLAVVINAVWIAIDLDFNGKPLLDSPFIFQLVEHMFVVLFTLEMVVRFVAFKDKRNVIFDSWFLFDFALVLVMLIESWIFTVYFLIAGGTGSNSLSALSILRIMRLLRVVRVVRLCRMVPELKTMVEGMIAGIRSVLITAIIFLTLTYTFAIFLRQLGVATVWGEANFHSVPIAVYTLLVESMLPDHAGLLTEIASETWYCGLIYFIFLLLTAITIMNMLIGILCDVVARTSEEETEKHGIESMSEKLKAILTTIDKDFDGMVSKAEFQSIVENRTAVRALNDVGVDVGALVSDADFIFNDRGSGLPFEDFKEEVLKFRITSAATNGTVAATRRFMRISLEQIAGKLTNVEMLVTKYLVEDGRKVGF